MTTERKTTIVLDGPIGTQLEARGIALDEPSWSAAAIRSHPSVLASLHREYAEAGAVVHTAATFRTGPAHAGADARSLTLQAVAIARSAVPADHRVLGSVGPLADCYRPEDTPVEVRGPHEAHVKHLAESGVDGILVETFADPRELAVAVAAAVTTGLPVWASFTAGFDASLLDVDTGIAMARDAAARGAERVLVNCVAIDRVDPWCEALARSGLPWGVYANGGAIDGPYGWTRGNPAACVPWFERWRDLGAGVIGACCGMGPEHVRQIARITRRGASSTTLRTRGSGPPQ